MGKFKGKYRIPSARLQTWDYGSNGMYFITICTKNREHYFGEIANGQMILSEIGLLANKYWNEIPEHFPFVILDAFVVMPNHVHGIIIMNKNDDHVQTPNLGVSTDIDCRTAAASKKWKPGILGLIMNQYKRVVTINARKIYPDFAWQPRYHDHIIRDNESRERIKNYIINNPKKWHQDTFNTPYVQTPNLGVSADNTNKLK